MIWFRIKYAFGTLTAYRRMIPQTVALMSRALQCSQLRAISLYIKSTYIAAREYDEFTDYCKRGSTELLVQADTVRLLGTETLAALEGTQRPILVATIHMGHFQLGLLNLVKRIKPTNRLAIFKLNPPDRNETVLLEAMQSLGYTVDVYRTREDGGREAFLALKRHQVVIIAIDLEVNVRSRSKVNYLNHVCLMQNGPATIAAMTKAIILPVVATKDANGRRILLVEQPIDTAVKSQDEALPQRVDRVTQALATLQEKWIRARPSDLHLWLAVAQTLGNTPSNFH